jgi:CRP/FNR family transcriptional regulator, dissimilatory nitrate respiration regulator
VELHFTKGEMLFLSGEEAKWLFVVVSGKIRVFLQNLEGREQVMHVDTAGSVLADVPVSNSCRKHPFPQQTDKRLS